MDQMNVLVVNTGGITLDLSLMDPAGAVIGNRMIDPWNGHDTDPVAEFINEHSDVDAVGHRVVHGGNHYDDPVVIDAAVEQRIDAASPLAPLHQHRALLGIHAARRLLPDVAHVACFDTAFHRTMPVAAATYALPAEWRRRWPLQRVGFHGLSHQHVANVAHLIAQRTIRPRRIVSCHLGSGASVCAILDGHSVDTTMGLTPLEGLVMANRSGSVDPGLVLWLIEECGLRPIDVHDGLYRHGGLAGLAGGSGDMRDIVARKTNRDPDAILAFDVYMHRLRREIAAMTASIGGIDILAFTGGVGEHMADVRAEAVAGLGYLGLTLDAVRNRAAHGDSIISANSDNTCIIVATGEAQQIAADTRATLAD